MYENTIVIGAMGSGKTSKIFVPMINNNNSNVIAIGFKSTQLSANFKIQELNSYFYNNFKNLSDNVFNNKKVYFELEGSSNDDISANINNILSYILNISNKHKILFAIDSFSTFINYNINKELFFKLVNSDNINFMLVCENIKVIRKFFDKKYEYIINSSNVISSKSMHEFSGEIRIRIPKTLHKKISIQADLENISLNQMIQYLLTESISKIN